MAVLANNSEGSSVPPEMSQNLEVDDEYNKYTPSADYNSTSGRNIFRNKKFTKKRHESKARRTESQDTGNVCCSDEDYPQAVVTVAKPVDLNIQQRSIPKIMMSINETIQKMSLKDIIGNPVTMASPSNPVAAAVTNETVEVKACGGENSSIVDWRDAVIDDSTTFLEADEAIHLHHPPHMTVCTSNNSSSCNLQGQPQGKRRRHRRKQQYKRMAVDVQSDKKCLQLKIPTSNSSEDSGIGKRKRNIVPTDTNGGIANVSVPVPVAAHSSSGQSTLKSVNEQPMHWQLDHDSDALMMDCEDMESSTKVVQGIHATEEESGGESDTQNDEIESLSDHNQDADDEESDYYNNDSSTTSLSESSFTILNPAKKFIPVHSREIRSGRRRLKNISLPSIENEELSRFLQNPLETVLKVYPSSEKDKQDMISAGNRCSLSFEEGCDQDNQRNWVQFTKTSQLRRNDLIKAAVGERYSDASSNLAVLFDSFVTENGKEDKNSDGCDDDGIEVVGNALIRSSGICANQIINSKRIKKGC